MPRYVTYDTKIIVQFIAGTDLGRERRYTFERYHCPNVNEKVTIYPADPPLEPLGYSEWEYFNTKDLSPVEARRSEYNRPRRPPLPEQGIFLLDL